MIPKLIIVRGLPGVGKTTFSHAFVDFFPQYIHLELDHFRYNNEGEYNFSHALNSQDTDNFLRSAHYLLSNGAFVIAAGIFKTRNQIFQLTRQNRNVTIFTLVNQPFQSIHKVPESATKAIEEEFESSKNLRDFNSKWHVYDVTLDSDNDYINFDTGVKIL